MVKAAVLPAPCTSVRHAAVHYTERWRKLDGRSLSDGGGSGPTCPVLRSREDISTGESDWDALFLDGTGLLKALLVDAHQQLPLEQVILKVITLRLCDILSATQGDFSRHPRQARMCSIKKGEKGRSA